MTSLTELNLHRNEIGDAGAERLAGVLGSLTSLKSLSLAVNDIGAEGRLAGLLGSLTSLNLSYNCIYEEDPTTLRLSWRGSPENLSL